MAKGDDMDIRNLTMEDVRDFADQAVEDIKKWKDEEEEE